MAALMSKVADGRPLGHGWARLALAVLASGWAAAALAAAVPLDTGAGHACRVGAAAQPLVLVAHRGRLAESGSENALQQMTATAAAGVGMLEMDLRTSSDGEVFLLHDDTLDRSTDGHGPLALQPAAALARLRLRGQDGVVSDAGLTRFADVEALARQYPRLQLMLDIKGVDLVRLLERLKVDQLQRRSMILTFDEATAQRAFATPHEALVSVLVTDATQLVTYRAMAGSHRLAWYVPQDARPSLFAAAHATGLPVISDAIVPVTGGSLDRRASQHGAALYADFLAQRPLDYLVSDQALVLAGAVCSGRL